MYDTAYEYDMYVCMIRRVPFEEQKKIDDIISKSHRTIVTPIL